MSKTVYQLLTALSRCAAGLWPVDRIIKDLTLSPKADPLKIKILKFIFYVTLRMKRNTVRGSSLVFKIPDQYITRTLHYARSPRKPRKRTRCQVS